MKQDSIGVVLNGYKRPKNILLQLEAINQQSIQPSSVKLWYNKPQNMDADTKLFDSVSGAYSYDNLGVWARFAYALNLDTEYVAIFDDDTIPGINWLRNCLDSMKHKEGLYGAAGCKMFGKQSYLQHHRSGWPTQNKEIHQVDFVGHAWFLKREWLYILFKYPILDTLAGEDMQLSFALTKDLNIDTFVPPHPSSDNTMWGSLRGFELGVDGNAISQTPGYLDRFQQYFLHLQSLGWTFLYEKK